MPAKATERERGAAAQVFRHVEAVLRGKVRATARAADIAQREHLTCTHRHWRKIRHRLAVEVGFHPRARERDQRIGGEAQRGTCAGQLERRCPRYVPQHTIAETESE